MVLLYLRHNNPATKADVVDFMSQLFPYQERRSCVVSIGKILDELAKQRMIQYNGDTVSIQKSLVDYVLDTWFTVTLAIGILSIIFCYALTGFSFPTLLVIALTFACGLKLVEEVLRVRL